MRVQQNNSLRYYPELSFFYQAKRPADKTCGRAVE